MAMASPRHLKTRRRPSPLLLHRQETLACSSLLFLEPWERLGATQRRRLQETEPFKTWFISCCDTNRQSRRHHVAITKCSALRVLKSADIILSEDTRHSGKLLHYYDIKAPLLSYHKFNESQREIMILRRLQEGHVVALISDAGTPGISDPGMELAKSCVTENIPVIPVPGPSAVVAALSASGLPTNEFTFVGFLPKHARSRRERLLVSANETATQIFFVPPHKLHQFLNEASSVFGGSRLCVIAREMTKLHEEFWRGTLDVAENEFSSRYPKGEITLLIEGKAHAVSEIPSEEQLGQELKDMISKGHSLSMAVKLVAEGTSAKRKHLYALALRLFGKQMQDDEHSN